MSEPRCVRCGHPASNHAKPGQFRVFLPCEMPDCDCHDYERPCEPAPQPAEPDYEAGLEHAIDDAFDELSDSIAKGKIMEAARAYGRQQAEKAARATRELTELNRTLSHQLERRADGMDEMTQALRAKLASAESDMAWIRKKLELPPDATMFSGSGKTIAGALHVLDANAHGYKTYIEAHKCDDKQGEIARLTVALAAAEQLLKDKTAEWAKELTAQALAAGRLMGERDASEQRAKEAEARLAAHSVRP